ncbi:MAG: PadR family transcriptional regulator [Candidatus Nanoarchaeia archaeon]
MGEGNKTGYLEVLVLSELESSARTGYELISIIGEKVGRKPSPGSIYPLLKKMLAKKLINVQSEGMKKNYFLTAQGKKLLNEKLKEKENMISKHMDLFRSMMRSRICKIHPEIELVNRIRVSRKISDDTAKLLLELKEEILESVLDKDYALREKELNEAISKSIVLIKKSSVKIKNTKSQIKNKKK